MSYESKFAHFIRRGGSGSIDLRLVDLVILERKFDVRPDNLVASIADNALEQGLADLNQYLPEGVSANIKGVDFSDIKAELDARISARIAEIGLPVNQNDPVIQAALQHAAAQVSARLQQDGMGLTEYIWRSRDDGRVRALHQDHDDQIFFWKTPPEDGAPGTAFGCRCSAEPVFTMEDLPEGATCERLTADKLREVFPDADEDMLEGLAAGVDSAITNGKLDTPFRLANFFGQASIEMGSSALVEENLRFSMESLIIKFDYFDDHPEEAEEFGRTELHPSNPEGIANRAYANRNGNVESGDGWRFRGRGMFQTTGRENYRQLTRTYRKLFGEFVDFEEQRDLLTEPKYAARAAAIFWLDHGFAEVADQGTEASVVDQITRAINSRTDSFKERADAVANFSSSGIFNNICQFSVANPTFDSL